jgi:isoamylase
MSAFGTKRNPSSCAPRTDGGVLEVRITVGGCETLGSEQHTEDNLEDNRDGANDNRSWNCGVPMVLGGDEFGRTQHGNNNARCQDNELSWVNWERVDDDVRGFVGRLVHLRQSEPVFRRRDFPRRRGVERLRSS